MKKILIIGESCKDIFVYCNANRLAPDLPIPVLSVIEKKVTLSEALQMDEAFFCGTATEISPIESITDKGNTEWKMKHSFGPTTKKLKTIWIKIFFSRPVITSGHKTANWFFRGSPRIIWPPRAADHLIFLQLYCIIKSVRTRLRKNFGEAGEFYQPPFLQKRCRGLSKLPKSPLKILARTTFWEKKIFRHIWTEI